MEAPIFLLLPTAFLILRSSGRGAAGSACRLPLTPCAHFSLRWEAFIPALPVKRGAFWAKPTKKTRIFVSEKARNPQEYKGKAALAY